jgi:hypothetical protein
MAANSVGLAWVAVSEMAAQTVSVDQLRCSSRSAGGADDELRRRRVAFPHAAQAICLIRRIRPLDGGKRRIVTVYAITSLDAHQPTPAPRLSSPPGYAVTGRSRRCITSATSLTAKTTPRSAPATAPQVVAAIRNLAIAIMKLAEQPASPPPPSLRQKRHPAPGHPRTRPDMTKRTPRHFSEALGHHPRPPLPVQPPSPDQLTSKEPYPNQLDDHQRGLCRPLHRT